MDKSTIIKMKKSLNVTDLSGEKVMIDFDSGKYFMIKGVGNDIWDLIQTEITVDDIVKNLMENYEITIEECETSVIDFLKRLKSFDIIE